MLDLLPEKEFSLLLKRLNLKTIHLKQPSELKLLEFKAFFWLLFLLGWSATELFALKFSDLSFKPKKLVVLRKPFYCKEICRVELPCPKPARRLLQNLLKAKQGEPGSFLFSEIKSRGLRRNAGKKPCLNTLRIATKSQALFGKGIGIDFFRNNRARLLALDLKDAQDINRCLNKSQHSPLGYKFAKPGAELDKETCRRLIQAIESSSNFAKEFPKAAKEKNCEIERQ